MARDEGAGAGSVLLAFLLGAVTGAAVALLYAPAPGRETRDYLGEKAREGRERANAAAEKGRQGINEGRETSCSSRSVTERFDQLVTKLNAGEGTAGQLLKDKQLYENMNGAVSDLRDLITEIKKNPRKYLNVKVSIF